MKRKMVAISNEALLICVKEFSEEYSQTLLNFDTNKDIEVHKMECARICDRLNNRLKEYSR